MESDSRCGACVDAVCKDIKLLGGEWRVGEDGKMHWRQLYSNRSVCPAHVYVLADDGKRRLYDI